MRSTVQEIIDAIIVDVPGAPFGDTVDTLKTGDAGQLVNAIATTFLATYKVIEQAIERGANLIITHEPTFYNHLDDTDWLKDDPVYKAKRQLIDKHQVAIWRFHDYLHSLQPDPTFTALLKALEWTAHAVTDQPFTCQLPTRSLGELVLEIKSKLKVESVRVVGDPQMTCKKVGLLVGAPGGRMQIEILGGLSLDVVICGEINEWEINEYVRDSSAAGHPKALVVIGHSVSEEEAMREIIPWLQARLPGAPISFIPTGQALRSA